MYCGFIPGFLLRKEGLFQYPDEEVPPFKEFCNPNIISSAQKIFSSIVGSEPYSKGETLSDLGDKLNVERFSERIKLPAIDGNAAQFKKGVIDHLSALNKSQSVLYVQDLFRDFPDADFKWRHFQDELETLGFVLECVTWRALKYSGENPAGALEALLKIQPLIIECGQALRIAELMALRNLVGDERFNQIIRDYYHGILEISNNYSLPIYDVKRFYHNFRDPETLKIDEQDIRVGDILYIAAPLHTTCYKPSSELNGFNLVCTRIDPSGKPFFKGFRSYVDTDFCFEDLEALFLESYNRPFTYLDLQLIDRKAKEKPDVILPDTTLTNQEVYDKLNKLLGPRFLEKLCEVYSKSKRELYQLSGLDLPLELKAKKIVGLMSIARLNPHALQQLVTGAREYKRGDKSHHASQPSLKYEVQVNSQRPISQQRDSLELHFQMNKPFQDKLYDGAERFYRDCIEAQREAFFGGLVLFGDPGTGKTHCCKAILDKLELVYGLRAWKKETSTEVLDDKDYVSALEISMNRGNKQAVEFVVNKLKEAFEGHDLFFIDDVNVDISEHTLVAEAAILYARRHKKMILITSNNSPFTLFPSDAIQPEGDTVNVVEVRGDDFRSHQKWWDHLVKGSDDFPMELPSGETLTDQQKKIMGWMKKLERVQLTDRTAGLAVYGSPGMGKTTAVKLALAEKEVLWIDGSNVQETASLKKAVADSNCQFVVIDDANEAFLKTDYRRVCLELCSADRLFNFHGEIVKVVMISNNQDEKALLNDLFALGNDCLKPKITSRFLSGMYPLYLGSGQDFRCQKNTQHSLGFIVSRSDQSARALHLAGMAPAQVVILDLKEFLGQLTAYKVQEKWLEMEQYRMQLAQRLSAAAGIVIDWNDDPKFAFEKHEFLQILDILAIGRTKVLFITDQPANAFCDMLRKLVKKAGDIQGKYASRLFLIDGMGDDFSDLHFVSTEAKKKIRFIDASDYVAKVK